MSFKLYVDSQFISPYAISAFVALREKGLEFAIETVDLDAGQNKESSYTAKALTGRVPCLVHDDFMLTESSAITEYLEEMYPAPRYPSLYPVQTEKRAIARQIQAWIRSDLLALREDRSTYTVFYKRADQPEQPLSPAAQAAADKLLRLADRVVNGDCLFGSWCIADTDLAIMLSRLVVNGDPVPQKLKDYVAFQSQRDSLQAWLKKINPVPLQHTKTLGT
ncbi:MULTISPECIES: glutathione transferase [unclassified Duganella]|uniref:glutathione transferase n=1 Tax=unclassified Duganella TaxID=2636909 RepID=UPI0006F43F6B|nr:MULTISPECIES: glutathione transferase [unclassified Duganella]KQV46010.1 glutathione S-transferase [Duganella sp. Root336D2]KRB81676.1 glutathione S-transferase [Duganella sp. Root198D2]